MEKFVGFEEVNEVVDNTEVLSEMTPSNLGKGAVIGALAVGAGVALIKLVPKAVKKIKGRHVEVEEEIICESDTDFTEESINEPEVDKKENKKK